MAPRVRTWLALGLLAVIVGISAWIRRPGFTQGGFANHDVAGILYNAMLLAQGKLPYVDNIEMKAPGTFYLARWLAGPAGTDIARFQIAANTWALGSLVAVAAIGWRRFGPVSAVVAAAVYGLHDAVLDTMDANYVTWAQLPLVLGVGAIFEARSVTGRRRLVWWIVAGALTGGATLLKRPAGIGWLMVMATVVWPTDLDGRRVPLHERGVELLAATFGLALAHLPIALHYVSHGHLVDLWSGYVLNEQGLKYAALGTRTLAEGALWEGLMALGYFLPLPLALAAFAARAPADRAIPSRQARLAGWLWLWFFLACVAAAVGFRFYKDYFLAAAAPLSLLAAAPWGLFGARSVSRRRWRALLALPLALLVARQGMLIHAERVNRARAHDAGGRFIARHVAAHASPDAEIWVWGWHLWDVYALTGKLAGTRMYKSRALITTGNDATWRKPNSPMRFVDGPAARTLIAELERRRPEWIVLGSAVPAHEFEALRELLRREYRRDRRVRLNRVQFWVLADAPGAP